MPFLCFLSPGVLCCCAEGVCRCRIGFFCCLVFSVAELGVLRCCGFMSPFAGMTCVRRAVVIDCLSGERSTNKAARFVLEPQNCKHTWSDRVGLGEGATMKRRVRAGAACLLAEHFDSAGALWVGRLRCAIRSLATCSPRDLWGEGSALAWSWRARTRRKRTRAFGCWRAGPKRAEGGSGEGAAPDRRHGRRLRSITHYARHILAFGF